MSSTSSTITLNADQEHAGLRATVMAIVLGGFVIGFLATNTILSSGDGLVASYSFPLSCILALLLALGAAALGETTMKRYWHSGRRLVLSDEELEAWLPEGKQVNVDWSGRVWAIRWHFSLMGYPRGGRERRLSKRHYCLACQLQQDDARVIVYSYMKGRQADQLLASGEFHGIDPAGYYERNPLSRLRSVTDRPNVPTNVLTGKEGPYWLAEQRRWSDGIELTEADFAVFYEAIRERVEK